MKSSSVLFALTTLLALTGVAETNTQEPKLSTSVDAKVESIKAAYEKIKNLDTSRFRNIKMKLVEGGVNGGGGLECALRAKAIAKVLSDSVDSLQSLNQAKVNLVQLKETLKVVNYLPGFDLQVDGKKVDAINFPQLNVVILEQNADRCLQIFGDLEAGTALLAHEALGILGIDDTEYQISKNIIIELKNWKAKQNSQRRDTKTTLNAVVTAHLQRCMDLVSRGYNYECVKDEGNVSIIEIDRAGLFQFYLGEYFVLCGDPVTCLDPKEYYPKNITVEDLIALETEILRNSSVDVEKSDGIRGTTIYAYVPWYDKKPGVACQKVPDQTQAEKYSYDCHLPNNR